MREMAGNEREPRRNEAGLNKKRVMGRGGGGGNELKPE